MTKVKSLRIAKLEAAFKAARGKWRGAGWRHKLTRGAGEARKPVLKNGEPVYCEGMNPKRCSTCYYARQCARNAEAMARYAIRCAVSGQWMAALREADEAVSLGKYFGQSIVWQPFRSAVSESASQAWRERNA